MKKSVILKAALAVLMVISGVANVAVAYKTSLKGTGDDFTIQESAVPHSISVNTEAITYSSSSIDVLILYDDDPDPVDTVRTYLSAFDDIAVVDIHDISISIPPLSTVLNYNAVLVYSNVPAFDAVALGDLLADYVDYGGGVVEATFLWQGEQVQGRFLAESYGPFTSAGWGYYSWAVLDVYDPTHPING